MKKKISIVTAGIILAMSMLAGCSGKTTDGQQAETAEVQTTNGQTENAGVSQTDAAAENESEAQENSAESEDSAKKAEETIPNQDVEFEE